MLEFILSQFSFVIKGFRSDNGSEHVNKKVAELLNKLNIEQTKSRAHQSNDNVLAESKNNSVVRKHMGSVTLIQMIQMIQMLQMLQKSAKFCGGRGPNDTSTYAPIHHGWGRF